MPKTCAVPGCAESAAGYSSLCQQHKQTQRRHGSPTQVGITGRELRPYAALAEARRARNPDSDAWGILEARWGAIEAACRETLRRYAEGHVSNRIALQAANLLCKVGESAAPWTVVRTVLGMYLLRDQQPRRIISDEAFDFQLTRQVVRLAPANAGTYWDQSKGRAKSVYRDIPPRVIKALVVPLKEAFGATGLMLASKEREEDQRKAEDRRRLENALGSLQ